MEQRTAHTAEIRVRRRTVHDHIGRQFLLPVSCPYMDRQVMGISRKGRHVSPSHDKTAHGDFFGDTPRDGGAMR